ncbi:MAG: M50 family metallopeptidase [Polyangiaceae bacterium]
MRFAGSWTIARPFGVPVRIHWSVPVCALLAGGIRVAPGAWLAFLLLVLIHEAGHAYVVRRVGARALALDVLGFGGLCWWEGSVTPIQRACIAWGGVWAQMVVLVLAFAGVAVFGEPDHWFAAQMVDVAIRANLWLMAINLLPIPPLDGKEAWSLFPLLRRRMAARRAERARLRGGARIPVLSARAPVVKSSSPPRFEPADRKGVSAEVIDPPEAYEPDETDFTPEVHEVLERARAIARDTARDPAPPPSAPGSKGDGPGRS